MNRILIIDDEPAAGNILNVLIEKHIGLEKALRVCSDPGEGIRIIREWKPHLLMLDIEMPVINGFSLLTQLEEMDFHVIFTTAYDKYAIKAIRFSALDYLLKPIDHAELIQAFQRYEKRVHSGKNSTGHKLGNLLGNLKDQNLNRLALNTHKGIQFKNIDEIIYCEGVNNYTRFYFLKQEPLVISRTIKEFDELLQDQGFFRIHKSFLVNVNRIARLEEEKAILEDDTVLPIARRRKEELKNRFVRSNR